MAFRKHQNESIYAIEKYCQNIDAQKLLTILAYSLHVEDFSTPGIQPSNTDNRNTSLLFSEKKSSKVITNNYRHKRSNYFEN